MMMTNTIDMGMVRRGAEALREIPHPDTWTSGQRNIARESAGIIDTLADALDAVCRERDSWERECRRANRAAVAAMVRAEAAEAERDRLAAEAARLRGAMPGADVVRQAACALRDTGCRGYAQTMFAAAERIHALDAGADTDATIVGREALSTIAGDVAQIAGELRHHARHCAATADRDASRGILDNLADRLEYDAAALATPAPDGAA